MMLNCPISLPYIEYVNTPIIENKQPLSDLIQVWKVE